MFDKTRLQEAVVLYKKDFDKNWPNEKFKWEAVKCFQDNWDIDASDFAEMLSKSLSKTKNLLASANNYPRENIEDFAKKAPAEVRTMFAALFDENVDVVSRILTFKAQAEVMHEKYGAPDKSQYQSENAISTYLWLRYPDTYYIYKFGEVKSALEKLNGTFRLKKGDYAENLKKFYSFYDALCEELKKDTELQEILKAHVTEDCYPDSALKTLTIDVGFYISRWIESPNDLKLAESVPATPYGADTSLKVKNPKQYEWIEFYTELATKLLDFKNDRKPLIEKIIAIYQDAEIHLPTLEKDNHIVDMDPFTVMGMFNKGITQANRQKLLRGFAKNFSVSAKVPEQFAGIPVLNNQQSVFYGFGTDRKPNDIDNLWNLFEWAIALAKSDTEENRKRFIEWYDKTQVQYLIKWNITMGLFWIRPYAYINLDS